MLDRNWNFETEGDTTEKHGIKSLNLQDIYQHDSGCFVDLFPVQSYSGLKKLERSILLRLKVLSFAKVLIPLIFSTLIAWERKQIQQIAQNKFIFQNVSQHSTNEMTIHTLPRVNAPFKMY